MTAVRRVPPLTREALLALLLASATSALLLWAGPPGIDLAGHAYQRVLFLRDGFSLWNNFWYAGRYSFVTYSILYYPLAGLLGIKLLALASIATAALAFAIVLGREWGSIARASSRSFAVVWAGTALSAAFPFALGAALALLALAVTGAEHLLLVACRGDDGCSCGQIRRARNDVHYALGKADFLANVGEG